MRECIYLTEQFKESVYYKFLNNLKTAKAKNDYNTLVCSICDFAKKDFTELYVSDAKAFFSQEINKVKEQKQSKITVVAKHSKLHSLSNYIIKYNLIPGYNINPFATVNIPEVDTKILDSSMPTLKQIDHILEFAKAEHQLYVALSIIVRCALTSGELCKLKLNDIIIDPNNNHSFILHYKNKIRYIKIPNDIMVIIHNYISSRSIPGEYLFYNKRNNPMRVRDLENLYAKTMPPTNNYTMQDIRNRAITYMLKFGASQKQTADYIHITPTWITRYAEVIPELELAAVDYVNIRINDL